MSMYKENIPNIQKLKKIKQELSLAELSGISNEDHYLLLLKQNKELLSLI
jgi:hypothetical protein